MQPQIHSLIMDLTAMVPVMATMEVPLMVDIQKMMINY